jgi:hypothetical protein
MAERRRDGVSWRRWWKKVASALVIVAAVWAYLLANGPATIRLLHRHATTTARPMPVPTLTLTASHYNLADGWVAVVPDRKGAAQAFGTDIRDCTSLWEAAQRLGAADVHRTMVGLTIEGSGLRTSTVVDVRARILTQQRYAAGAVVDCPGGSDAGVIPMRIKLDSGSPIALRVVESDRSEDGRIAGPFFAHRVITVRRGESVTAVIEAKTRLAFVTWKLQVTALVNGKRRTYLLGDDGRPFRTTAEASLYRSHPEYEFDWDPNVNKVIRRAAFP